MSMLRFMAGLLMAPDNDGEGGGGDVESADARAIRQVKEKLGGAEPRRAAEEDDDVIEVEVSDGRSDDDHDDPDRPPSSRAERRRERGEVWQENARLRAELEEARRAPPPALPPPQEALPSKAEMEAFLDEEFKKVQQRAIALEQNIQAHTKAGTLTEAILEQAYAEQRRIKLDEGVLQHRWAQVQDGSIRQRFQPPQQPVDPVGAQLRAEFQDVASDPRAESYATAYYQRELASIRLGEREQMSQYQLSREAWEAGRAMLQGKTPRRGNGGGRPPPTRESKARYAGMSSSSGAAGGGERTSTKVTITKQEDLMAQARFSHIPDPNKRRAMFVKMKQQNAAKRSREGSRA